MWRRLWCWRKEARSATRSHGATTKVSLDINRNIVMQDMCVDTIRTSLLLKDIYEHNLKNLRKKKRTLFLCALRIVMEMPANNLVYLTKDRLNNNYVGFHCRHILLCLNRNIYVIYCDVHIYMCSWIEAESNIRNTDLYVFTYRLR